MKKIILFATLLLLLLSLAACSSPEHKHTYTAVETVDATCVADGYIKYECSDPDCGHPYSKTLPAGHAWVAGDCTTPKTCSACGETVGTATGHIYENKICVNCKHELVIDLSLPEANDENPLIIRNTKSGKDAAYEINSIAYTFDGTTDDSITVTIILEGEKLSDDINGDDKNVSGKIAYKIYDEDGFVIFSSTKDTMMLTTGEKFKNLKISLSGFNAGQKYVLEFFDYYS